MLCQPPSAFAFAADLLRPRPADSLAQDPRLDAADWDEWLTLILPSYCTAPFAPHHAEFWRWVWAIEPGTRPDPFVAIWARGGAKSSSAEMAAVVLAARSKRRYALWVNATQEQADDHVSNVATMLESRPIETHYPALADRMMGKYGNSKGWRRNRLRTAAGFTLDAIGLDTAARGAKLEEYRPDLIIFDDIDSGDDSTEITERKIRTITRALIPAGSPDVAILAIQNLIHPDSIFAQLADGRAKFLRRRYVSGPIPAIEGLVYAERGDRTVITAGEPTWAGQSLAACQASIDDSGISAFLAECQHDVAAAPGGMYDHLEWKRCAWADVPWGMLIRTVVWVDPAGTSSSTSDSCGLQADAIAVDGTIYRLHSWEERATPQEAMIKALRVASWLGADKVGIETDYGGDTWLSVFAEARRATGVEVAFDSAKAGAGHGSKAHRSAQMLADYERPRRIIHVEGTHLVLEAALRRFPKTKPFDLADACLAPGTLIATADGPRAIEMITVGTLVHTRQGLCRVTAAGMTKPSSARVQVGFDNGAVLRGTANHRVWTDTRGWQPLGDLRHDDIVLVWPDRMSSEKLSSSTATRMPATHNLSRTPTGDTSHLSARVLAFVRRCTEKYGRQLTGLFRMVTTSIILMAIRSITPWRTWSASLGLSTVQSMALPSLTTSPYSIWKRFDRWLPSGIGATKVERGIASMGHAPGWTGNIALSCVPSAATSSVPATRLQTSRCAPGLVGILSGTRPRSTTWIGPAPSAGNGSVHTNITPKCIVGARVQTECVPATDGPVFNLSVADCPEYFANGILVHNCFWSWRDLRMNSGAFALPAPDAGGPSAITEGLLAQEL